jgi:hypothetical protein
MGESKRVKGYFLLIVIVMAGLGIGYFYQWKVVRDSVLVANEKLQQIETYALAERQEKVFESFIESTEEGRAQLSNYFVSSENFVSFMEKIEALASDTNIDIVRRNLIEAPTNVEMNFQLQGLFSDILYFVALLENIPLNVDVERVDLVLRNRPDGAEDPLWTVDIDIVVARYVSIEEIEQ